MAAMMVEQVMDVFRQADTQKKGTVTRNEMLQVLQTLDSNTWAEEQVDTLLEAYGMDNSSKISYEPLIKWIMGAPDGALIGDPVCQAAFEGSMLTLKELCNSKGIAGVSRAVGYVQVNGEIVGMWTMIPNTFQLKPVREDPKILPANAMQWAAFGGHAHILEYLMNECSMKKEDKSSFGETPFRISTSHRLGLEGDVIEDEGDARAVLDDKDKEAPLCAASLNASLKKALTKPLADTS